MRYDDQSALAQAKLPLRLQYATCEAASKEWDQENHTVQVSGASVHWYGKAEVALQRKVGHVTITATDRQTALASLSRIDDEAEAALSVSTGGPSLSVQALSVSRGGPSLSGQALSRPIAFSLSLVAEAAIFMARYCEISVAHQSIAPIRVHSLSTVCSQCHFGSFPHKL